MLWKGGLLGAEDTLANRQAQVLRDGGRRQWHAQPRLSGWAPQPIPVRWEIA